MTIQSVSWAKSVLDTVFAKAAEPIVGNMRFVEHAHGLFADTESREAFTQELTYKILYRFFGKGDAANQLVGGMPLRQFLTDCQKAENDPNLPKIPVPINHKTMLQQTLVCTYYYGQYQYQNIRPTQGDRVLDAGASFGETALWFLQAGAKEVFSFEVDPGNLEILQELASANLGIHVQPYALGSKPGERWYVADPTNPGAGRVRLEQTENAVSIPTTSVDAFCQEQKWTPSYIKMDIEGSELDALIGAEKTICEHKPKLAICLYHTLSHMWQVPLLLHQFVPEYRFFCKKSHPYQEFVLYAAVLS